MLKAAEAGESKLSAYFRRQKAKRKDGRKSPKRNPPKGAGWQTPEEHAAVVAFHANKRRAAKMARTPPWANLDAMRGIYEEAQRLTALTGIQHQVDHVVPLQGRLVSGLHVETNLQILTGAENSRKRNRFEVEG